MLAFGHVGAKSELSNLVKLISLHLGFATIIHVELEDAIDSLKAALVVPVHVASRGVSGPVSHETRLLHQHLASSFLKTREVSQMDLERDKLTERVLIG